MDKREKLTFDEYIYGEVFNQQLERAIRNKLLDYGCDSEDINLMIYRFRNHLEPLSTLNEMVSHFVMKEDLDDNIHEYANIFGLDNITFGLIYLDSLADIYKEVRKRCLSSYSEYEEKYIRNIV